MQDHFKQLEKYEKLQHLATKYDFYLKSNKTLVISQQNVVDELHKNNSTTDLLRTMQSSGSFSRISFTQILLSFLVIALQRTNAFNTNNERDKLSNKLC